jgi:hypothetical protein
MPLRLAPEILDTIDMGTITNEGFAVIDTLVTEFRDVERII